MHPRSFRVIGESVQDPRAMSAANIRAHLSDLLHGLSPRSERERLAKERALQELELLETPMDEGAGPIHVTASAFIVSPRGILLHEHKSLGLWLQPGGHIEPGEWPQDAALREGEEETGLVLSHPKGGAQLIRIDVHPGPRGHTHLDVGYLLLAKGSAPTPPSGESQQVAWFALAEAVEQAADDLKEFLPSLLLAARAVGVSIPEHSSSA